MSNAFQICNFEKSFVVLAETAEEKSSWMKDIQSCIDKQCQKGNITEIHNDLQEIRDFGTELDIIMDNLGKYLHT
jgi:hypothetical protein